MTDVYRVTIRLTPDLYAQLEAQGRSGKPLAAIVRDALLTYLAQQPQLSQLPTTAEVPTTTLAAMTAMAARLDTLEAQIQHLTTQLTALTATAARPQATPPATATDQPWQPQQPRQPAAASGQSQQPERSRQPQQPEPPALDAVPPFDTSKFVLGKLCPRGHEYYGTGQTLRRLFRHVCPACDVERTRDARRAKRERPQ